MKRRFTILGAGMGQPEHLTGEARAALCAADLALSTPRLARSLSALRPVTACATGEVAQTAIAAALPHVAIVVSGDTGFFSLTRSIADSLRAHGEVSILCGQSSMQYFCARLGTAYDDAAAVSLHGRPGSLVGAVSYHKKVFALTGGAQNAQALCRALTEAGLGFVRVARGENLGAPDETIVTGTAAELAALPCGSLAVLLLENDRAADARRALRDTDFVRGETPMTKQEVRWTAVNLLDVRETDVVYDVGAGTGSVAIELARHAARGTVYAVERKPEGLRLIEENRVKLGAYNVVPVNGRAPEALAALPAPDAVFIGGSGGELPEILRQIREKNPAVRVCVSAIALETLALAQESFKTMGFCNSAVCQIAAARGRRVGAYTMMTANNPVFLLTGGGRDDNA